MENTELGIFVDSSKTNPTQDGTWVVARTFDEFKQLVLNSPTVSIISFGDCLDDGNSALACMGWFSEVYLNSCLEVKVVSHSKDRRKSTLLKRRWREVKEERRNLYG